MTDRPSEVGEGLCFPPVNCLVCGGVHKIEDCPKARPSADRGEGQAGPSDQWTAMARKVHCEIISCDEAIHDDAWRGPERSPCGWCRMVALAIKRAVDERDGEWWEATAGIDVIPSEPAAVKAWWLIERESDAAALRASGAALAEMTKELIYAEALRDEAQAEASSRFYQLQQAETKLATMTKERDDCYTHRTEIIGRIPHLVEADRAEATKAEMRFRKALWFGHGHFDVYGDDGEMQCGRVNQHGDMRGPIDFRRDGPNRVVQAALGAARAETSKAVLDEREACALLAEDLGGPLGVYADVAGSIRARSSPPPAIRAPRPPEPEADCVCKGNLDDLDTGVPESPLRLGQAWVSRVTNCQACEHAACCGDLSLEHDCAPSSPPPPVPVSPLPTEPNPNCHCAHLNCRGKCDCPVCVPNPPGTTRSTEHVQGSGVDAKPSEEPR